MVWTTAFACLTSESGIVTVHFSIPTLFNMSSSDGHSSAATPIPKGDLAALSMTNPTLA